MFFILSCDDPTYQVKYAIDLDNPVNANITYKIGSNYKTTQIDNKTWESESFQINNDLYYYYIKLDSHNSNGNFFIVVDNEVYRTSSISTDSRIDNVFSGYIDMDYDETAIGIIKF